MTREDAIKNIKEHCYFANLIQSAKEALDMAIKALEQEPCDDVPEINVGKIGKDTNVTTTDAVDRQTVNELVDELARAISDERCCMSRGRSTATIMRDILHLPSVTAQPKMGRWVKTPKAIMGDGYMWYCDKCKYEVYQDSSRPYPSEKFCPNCGQPKKQEVEG